MEELIEKIEELIIVINKNSVPLWLSIVGILIPIFISIVVAIQAYIQHNSNKKLQMYISEKEARIQMHSDFLIIYDSFCIAQQCIGPSRNKIDEIFANPNFLSQWYDDLHKASFGLCQSTNRALLLLPESAYPTEKLVQNILPEPYDGAGGFGGACLAGGVPQQRNAQPCHHFFGRDRR